MTYRSLLSLSTLGLRDVRSGATLTGYSKSTEVTLFTSRLKPSDFDYLKNVSVYQKN